MKRLFASFLLFLILFTQTAGILEAASRSTYVTFPRKLVNGDLQVVPNSATDLTTTDTWVFQVTIANTTASAVTFTMTDKAATAKTLFPTTSLAANTLYIISFPEGQKMKGGISWTAGTASALHASVVAFYL